MSSPPFSLHCHSCESDSRITCDNDNQYGSSFTLSSGSNVRLFSNFCLLEISKWYKSTRAVIDDIHPSTKSSVIIFLFYGSLRLGLIKFSVAVNTSSEIIHLRSCGSLTNVQTVISCLGSPENE